jgi:hypothetical protein
MKTLKRLWPLILLCTVLGVGLASAQTVYYANQATIAWDAVTQYADGTNFPVGTIVTYEVYLKDGTQTKIGQTTNTQFLVTLTDYLIHDVGVRASITSGSTTYYSELAWSSVDGKPSPFVLQVYPAPAKVQNLRVE